MSSSQTTAIFFGLFLPLWKGWLGALLFCYANLSFILLLMTLIRLDCFALEKRQMRTADTFDQIRCSNCVHTWQQLNHSQRDKMCLLAHVTIMIVVLFRREYLLVLISVGMGKFNFHSAPQSFPHLFNFLLF